MHAHKYLTLSLGMLVSLSCSAQTLLTNGLVAHYRLDGNADDTSGGGVNGTAYDTSFGSDRFETLGSGAVFNGTSGSNIKINSTNWHLLPPFTVSVWFKFNANAGTQNPRVLSTSGFEIGTQGTAGARKIFFNNTASGSGAGMDSSNSVPSGVWVHAVGVREGDQLRLYVNGMLAGTTTFTPVPDYSRGLPEIGGNFGNGFDGFSGAVDDVRLYNRSLSASEVQTLYTCESQAGSSGTFRFVYGNFTWQEAKADAERRGGHLATFRDAQEWLAGQAVINQFGSQNVWIGGYQPTGSAEPAGGWAWITGQPWSFTAWAAGEPNQNQGQNEDVVYVGFNGNGWVDAPSDTRLCYLLQVVPRVELIKAVKPSFTGLRTGATYQLQLSSGLNTWTNHGAPFEATADNMVYPQYWDVDGWGRLFFRLIEQ